MNVAIIVVGFRNAENIADCLHALRHAALVPSFEVFISENGGSTATDRLVEAIEAPRGPCRPSTEPMIAVSPSMAARHRLFRLKAEDGTLGAYVHVAEMTENLGYAGGVNAWLRPLLQIPGWEAAWILNPDTEPSATALAELTAYAERRNKGMVGACLVPTVTSDKIQNRGLAWHKLEARTIGVDVGAPRTINSEPDDVESRLDSPSGAATYVRRELIETIGLMDDSYFLYYEDLEWGFRAKALGAIGYAHLAVVPHKGGQTILTSGGRSVISPLAVYLEFRNRILFVRKHLPRWLPWTVFMQGLYIGIFAVVGGRANTIAACRGLVAGLRGETGRPERYMCEHRI